MSLKEKIRAADDIKKQIVKIPEWGAKIEVRTMMGAERAILFGKTADEGGQPNFQELYPEMIIACCFDPKTGERLFSKEDIPWLMEKSCTAMERLATVASELSGITEKAVEGAEKN